MNAACKSMLKQFAELESKNIKCLHDSPNSAVYEFDGKLIAKLSATDTARINIDRFVKNDKALKIIRQEVSFGVPVCDLIAYRNGTTLSVYKKIPGEPANLNQMSETQLKTFVKTLAEGLCEMHSIGLDKFKDCGLHHANQKKNFQLDIKQLRTRLKTIVKENHLAAALNFLQKYAMTIDKTNPMAVSHCDLGHPNIIVDSKTKKLNGLIDFDYMSVSEPCSDFSLLNMELFRIAYKFYNNKYLLGKDEKDAVIRQQAYHVLKILLWLRDTSGPKKYRDTAIRDFSNALESALNDLGLLKKKNK